MLDEETEALAHFLAIEAKGRSGEGEAQAGCSHSKAHAGLASAGDPPALPGRQ